MKTIARRLRKDYPQGVVGVYDNGGRSSDRYTVVYSPVETNGVRYWPYLAMSESPFHPQGIGLHGETEWTRPGVGGSGWGNACGKVINFAELPDDCKVAVQKDLSDY